MSVSKLISNHLVGGSPSISQPCQKFSGSSLGNYDIINPLNYLDTYNAEDIQLICCEADSSTMWMVPPIVQSRYAGSIDQNTTIIFTWIFTRERPKGKESVKYESYVKNCPCLDDVKQVMSSSGTLDGFNVPDAYPQYFRVTSSGEVRPLEALVCSSIDSAYIFP